MPLDSVIILLLNKYPEAMDVFDKILSSSTAIDLVIGDLEESIENNHNSFNFNLFKTFVIMIFNCLKNNDEKRTKFWENNKYISLFIRVFNIIYQINQPDSSIHIDYEVNEWFTRLFILLIDPEEGPTILQNIDCCVYQNENYEEIKSPEIDIPEYTLKAKQYLLKHDALLYSESIKIVEKDINLVMVSDIFRKLMHYLYILTCPKEEFKLSVSRPLSSYLCLFLNKIVSCYWESYTHEVFLRLCYANLIPSEIKSELSEKFHHSHLNILESVESVIMALSNLTAEGEKANDFRDNFIILKVLQNTLKWIGIIDRISDKLIEMKAIPKNTDNEVANMESKDGKTSTHPLAGFITKWTRLVANLVFDNPEAVKHFEAEMSNVGLMLSHTKLDFVNAGAREHWLLWTKYLIDQSEIIRNSLKEITMLSVDTEGQEILEKVGLKGNYFIDKKKVSMVESPFIE